MFLWARESAFSKLVWVERRGFAGWGCAECDWMFNPFCGPPVGESVEEMKENFQAQLSKEFLAHACDKQAKAANASSAKP
jgi:hypothetical protein